MLSSWHIRHKEDKCTQLSLITRSYLKTPWFISLHRPLWISNFLFTLEGSLKFTEDILFFPLAVNNHNFNTIFFFPLIYETSVWFWKYLSYKSYGKWWSHSTIFKEVLFAENEQNSPAKHPRKYVRHIAGSNEKPLRSNGPFYHLHPIMSCASAFSNRLLSL